MSIFITKLRRRWLAALSMIFNIFYKFLLVCFKTGANIIHRHSMNVVEVHTQVVTGNLQGMKKKTATELE